jgi:uncharacterized protein
MPPLLRILALACAGYAAVSGILFLTQRRLMYFPDVAPPDVALAGVTDLSPVAVTTADGLTLLAWYRPPSAQDLPTLVYFHGNAGHIGHRGPKVRPYLDAGFGMLLLAWRGYGGNPGSPSEEGLYHDGRAALDFLSQSGVPGSRIVLYGESLGAGIAVQMATERHVAAIVLEAPFPSTADVAAHHYWYLPTRYLVLDRFDSKAKIAHIGTSLLIVHGERDRIVPPALARALYDAAKDPKEAAFIATAGHNDLYDHGAADRVIEYLRRTIR